MVYWYFLVLFVLQSVLVPFLVSGYMTISGNCVFPFTYKGAVYRNCTTKDWHRPWCSTTANYDKDEEWKGCAVSGQTTISPGKNCVFPFTYRGVVYRSCSTANFWYSHHAHHPWCSTTANYRWSGWEYCKVSGKTISGKNCVFPFTYKGAKYSSCTTEHYHNRPWCSTTANYDKDGKWGNCLDFIASGQWTWEFKSCVFPFTYKDVVYNSCTTKDHVRPWCSTTALYEGKWGNCI